jgi:hypothetical protein
VIGRAGLLRLVVLREAVRVSQEEVIASVILSKKVYMYVCPVPNGFRDRPISLYSSKIVDNKDITYCF